MNKQTFILWPESDIRRRVWANVRECLRALPTDKAMQVVIEPYKKAKTPSQRGWFHKLLDIWAKDVGLTPGQTKEIVKGFYFGWRTVKVAGVEFTAAEGSSEALDKIGYSDLIETTYRLAAEMGVVLPEADRWRKAG